jgi:hypothetical protein
MTKTYLSLGLPILLSGFLMIACEEDTEQIVLPSTVQFESSELSVSEDTEKSTIKILLNNSAKKSGELTVEIGTSGTNYFTTEPAAVDGVIKLPVAVGQSVISFDVLPVDNSLLDGDRTIEFTIASTTEGFTPGTQKTLSATLVDDETPVLAFFMLNLGTIRENSSTPSSVIIALSHTASANGAVHVSFQSDKAVYGTHYTTEPAATNGQITLPVEIGINHLEIKVFPINDALFNGDKTIACNISDVEGGIIKGENLLHELKITDDELQGTGKGYEIFAGNWRYKKNYEYDEAGRLTTVQWEQNTPAFSQGTYNYFYNTNNEVIKVVESPVKEKIFLWENGKVVKTEVYTNSVLTQYTLYGYDAAGNVGEAAVHYRQPDGQLKLGSLFVYLYKVDGNLYKQLIYSPIPDSDDYHLDETRTYDNYLDVENPFPMVEILPHLSTQPNLPSTYRVEQNGHDLLYQLSYEFSEEGKPVKRTATFPGGSETAYYEYY